MKQMVKTGCTVALGVLCLCCSRPVAPAAGVESVTLIEDSCSWDGALLPAYPEGQPGVTVKRITVAPKARLVWHKHAVINAGVLLRGTLRVEDDRGRTLTLHEGDPIIELVGRYHYGENPGDVPAEILVFYAGNGSLPLAVPRDSVR